MDSESFRNRLHAIGSDPSYLGVDEELKLLEALEVNGATDEFVAGLVDDRISAAERLAADSGFQFPQDPGIAGPPVIEAVSGMPVSVSFGAGGLTHGLVVGPTGYGKTVLLGLIAAVHTGPLLILTANRSFLGLQGMGCVNACDASRLRLNPWECADGVDPSVWDEQVNAVLGKGLDLQYGVLELGEVCHEIRTRGDVPTVPGVISALRAKQTRAYSRRNQYRDSAILNLEGLLKSCGECFSGRGLPPDRLIGDRLIVVMPFAPRANALLQHLFLVWTWLVRTTKPAGGHLLFVVDEAQSITEDRALPGLILQLRHANTSWLGAYQNMSKAPVELRGNVDFLASFRATERDDRIAVAKAMNVSTRAEDAVFVLAPREVAVFLPRSACKYAFLGAVVPSATRSVDADELRVASDEYLESVRNLVPSEDVCAERDSAAVAGSAVEDALRRFLVDVGTKEFEFSPIGKRWERSGVRSVELRSRVQELARTRGLISTENLAVSRGKPHRLVKLSPKGFESVGLTPWRVGRGKLSTRAATHHVRKRLEQLGFDVAAEAPVNEKQVDLLAVRGDERIAVEIAGTDKHEAHNALAIVDHVDRVVIIGVNSAVSDAVRRRICAHEKLNTEKVLAIHLSKALKPEWEGWT